MCKHGTDTLVEVTIPARLSHTGKERRAIKGVDSCIAPIVEALNAHGIKTDYSCCGHGKQDGEIKLADGRILVIKTAPEGRPIKSGQSLEAGAKKEDKRS